MPPSLEVESDPRDIYARRLQEKRTSITTLLFDPKRIFPDADCMVITQMRELQNLLDD